jgi:hypothetical protein
MSTDYSGITNLDARNIEETLLKTYNHFKTKLRIIEIGVCAGCTARGMKNFLDKKQIPFEYFGIDNGRDGNIQLPFPEATLILGDSAKVYYKVPGQFHFVFIDGCHCILHTMLDFLLYGDKLLIGGFVVFHDTSPLVQGLDPYQDGTDSPQISDFAIACKKGIELLKFENRNDWEKIIDTYDYTDKLRGGVTIYKKIK